jgi:hypothetical protein
MLLERFDGSVQVITASGPPLALAAGDLVDCSLTCAGWTMTATASNRANAQVSIVSVDLSHAPGFMVPTISRVCCYPVQGTVYLDDMSFVINHRKPARFILAGASRMQGEAASSESRSVRSVIQSNYNEVVCNNSCGWNSTGDALSVLPEILAHQPDTAIIDVGGNDVLYGYPASQWQSNYSNLVNQLRANGVNVKCCLGPPRTFTDETPLKNWILNNIPPADVIDTWTPFLQGASSLASAYDCGDGTHLNDAGQLLLGQIIISNLPPGIRVQPQNQSVPAGASATFTVDATGRQPFTYHWFFNGTNALSDGGKISGSATATLTLSNVLGADSGAYSVVIGSPAGSVAGAPPPLLTVADPIITRQPINQTNLAGATALFSVEAFGTTPVFQWLKDGGPIARATNATLILPGVSPSDAASYSVAVSNAYGSLTSSPAVLVVVPQPNIDSARVANGTLTLTWESLAGKTYRLQFKADLGAAGWQDIPPGITATGPTTTAAFGITNSPQGFYRLALP